MPRRDGTGPRGKGPRTGKGLGPCKPIKKKAVKKQPVKKKVVKKKTTKKK